MINKVTLVGRVGFINPMDFKEVGNTSLMKFSLATNNSRYDKDKGEYVNDTTWHNVVVWGNASKYCRDHVYKGDLLYVDGAIKIDKYEKDGEEKTSYSISSFTVKKLSKSQEPKQEDKREQQSFDDIPF